MKPRNCTVPSARTRFAIDSSPARAPARHRRRAGAARVVALRRAKGFDEDVVALPRDEARGDANDDLILGEPYRLAGAPALHRIDHPRATSMP